MFTSCALSLVDRFVAAGRRQPHAPELEHGDDNALTRVGTSRSDPMAESWRLVASPSPATGTSHPGSLA